MAREGYHSRTLSTALINKLDYIRTCTTDTEFGVGKSPSDIDIIEGVVDEKISRLRKNGGKPRYFEMNREAARIAGTKGGNTPKRPRAV